MLLKPYDIDKLGVRDFNVIWLEDYVIWVILTKCNERVTEWFLNILQLCITKDLVFWQPLEITKGH